MKIYKFKECEILTHKVKQRYYNLGFEQLFFSQIKGTKERWKVKQLWKSTTISYWLHRNSVLIKEHIPHVYRTGHCSISSKTIETCGSCFYMEDHLLTMGSGYSTAKQATYTSNNFISFFKGFRNRISHFVSRSMQKNTSQ